MVCHSEWEDGDEDDILKSDDTTVPVGSTGDSSRFTSGTHGRKPKVYQVVTTIVTMVSVQNFLKF